jgi:hypothetical protein
VRYCPSIADTLPVKERGALAESVSTLLRAVGISEVVCKSVIAQAIFIRCIRLAKADPGNALATAQLADTVAFDPFEFLEELLSIQHGLLCLPGPLRVEGTEQDSRNDRTGSPPVDTSQLSTENFISNHRARITVPVQPPPTESAASSSLESALRICCLLYHKELIRDFPRNLGGYSILLTLLRFHVGEILASHRRASPPDGSPTQDQNLRPLLLWICLVGNLMSLIADQNEARFGSDRCDRLIFRTALEEVLGITLKNVSTLGAEDFVMCSYLDLKDVQGAVWDDRLALSDLLLEGGA